jgi:FkbM family methyltransferase
MGEILVFDKPTFKTINNGYGNWLWPAEDTESVQAVWNELPKLMEVIKLCNRDVAVQAGGNCGVFPSILAKHFGVVYTFEPDLVNFSCLCANVPEYNVYKFPAALGNDPGVIGMTGERSNCGAYMVGKAGTTPVILIDHLGLSACDLIYLDVEGFELQALRGASKTIDLYKPVIVTEEKGIGKQYGYEDSEIGEFLADFGYLPEKKIGNDQIYLVA